MVKLADEFGRLHGFGRWVFGVLAEHAGLEVAGQKFNAKRIKGRADSGNLVQDIDAISVLIDHALNPGDLAGDTINPSPNFFPSDRLHASIHIPCIGTRQVG